MQARAGLHNEQAQIPVLQLSWCNKHHCWREVSKPQCFPHRLLCYDMVYGLKLEPTLSPLKIAHFRVSLLDVSVANWSLKLTESGMEYTCLQVLG